MFLQTIGANVIELAISVQFIALITREIDSFR